jgi:hypothetical protein
MMMCIGGGWEINPGEHTLLLLSIIDPLIFYSGKLVGTPVSQKEFKCPLRIKNWARQHKYIHCNVIKNSQEV